MAIYYGCPDKNYPVGGIRVNYRHVDVLNRNGFDAFVLHHYFPFRCTWFENDTRVAHEVRYPDLSRSLPARRVHYGVDPRLFAFTRDKKRQIAYMPRKNPHDLHQVLRRLRLTGRLDGWDVVEIADRPEAETGAILRESAVFLSSGHPEGFGLPAAEAMRAGCVVVGYHGYGGREFLTEEHAFPIPVGDVVAFADTVAAVLEELETAPDALGRRSEEASRFVAANYSPEREERDLLEIWSELVPTRVGSGR